MNEVDPGTGTFRGFWPPGAMPDTPEQPMRFLRKAVVIDMSGQIGHAFFNEVADAVEHAAASRRRWPYNTFKVFEEVES